MIILSRKNVSVAILLFLFLAPPTFSKDIKKIMTVKFDFPDYEREVAPGIPVHGYPVMGAHDLILKNLHLLRRMDIKDSSIVSTVWFKSDGRAVLNPVARTPYFGLNYNDIPELRYLTPALCNQLWGSPSISAANERSYKLTALKDDRKTSDTEYWIDTIFENGKLHKYRVHTNTKTTVDWTVVQPTKPNEIFIKLVAVPQPPAPQPTEMN